MVVDDVSAEGWSASGDVARCCSPHEPFYPEYVNFPGDCPIDNRPANPPDGYSVRQTEVEDDCFLSLNSASLTFSEWPQSTNFGYSFELAEYDTAFPCPISLDWTANQVPSLSHPVGDFLSTHSQDLSWASSAQFPSLHESFNGASPAFWQSEHLAPEQTLSQVNTANPSSSGVSPSTPDSMSRKHQRADNNDAPRGAKQTQKRPRPLRVHSCGWIGCQRAYDDVQELK